MDHVELTPRELLGEGFAAPHVTDAPWVVRWDRVRGDVGELVLKSLPEVVEFSTSGTTGAPRTWSRTREYLWAEAGMLAGLLAPGRPGAAVSFVPPSHLYGALSSVLVPAHLGVPAWYRPGFAGAMPPVEQDRCAVMAIPWIFSLLLRHLPWVRDREHVGVLHASGMLPSSAADFLRAADGRGEIVEVFGSTESGGVATRRWTRGEPPDWELFPDVEFARSTPDTPDDEVPLAVRSPRIAFQDDGRAPESWELDDFVEVLDDRRFRFTGRRSRIVNLNGRRLNLDVLEDAARRVLDVADLALQPVADAMIGEHVELLVVPRPGQRLGDLDLSAAIDRMGVRPRRVRDVEHIDRTELGKFRRVQRPTNHAGADA
ncbi:class I adenylate-forming enzyme family protein [Actinosynnema sp. NPDC023587]|uniref:class I adenylate-forming enzyme family protein n=1 Tax=Actinosynnema sp. NPDC023587 TaxID=3154695 RepID=UPI0034103443